MKKTLILFIVIIILLPVSSMAQKGNDIPIKISINTTYIGFNKAWFVSDYRVNMSINRLGHMTYIEEYFTVDSNSNPKPVMSKTHYDGNITNHNVSFQMMRPMSRSGKAYNMIRGAVVLDGKRIYEKWLKTSSGAHLTYTIGNGDKEGLAIKKSENIAKFEIRDKNLITGLPVTYQFTTSDIAIYEVNVTGITNESYISLNIKLLKGVPIYAKSFPWTVYKYYDISLDTRQIRKMTLRYRVENSWINNSNVSDIRLFRWNGTAKKWYELSSKIINKDSNYTYYESATNLSEITIAIAELKKNSTANINKTNLSINNTTFNSTNNSVLFPTISETGKKKGFSIMDFVRNILAIFGGRI